MVSCDISDELASVLKIGDNLAVHAKDGNSEGASF